MSLNIAMFGEAEKGVFATPIKISSLTQLATSMGNPPEESLGISLAIQALLFKRIVFYIRVEEEGFSTADYFSGIERLKESKEVVHAVCMPGVGDANIIGATDTLLTPSAGILVTQEKDLYDYLTMAAHPKGEESA